MIRKTTAAALVLSAVPAALALTIFAGTAQAGDTPWPVGIASDDTPWTQHAGTPSGRGITASDDDTPWGHITLPAPPVTDAGPAAEDTPWR